MRRWSTTAVTAWSALPPLRLALRRDAASPRARRRRACSWHRCRARPPRTRSRRSFRSTVKCSRSSCSRTVLRGPMPSCSTRCVPPRVSLVARVFCLCLPSLCVCCFSVLLYLGGVLVRGVLYCIGDQRWCWWRGVGVGVVFCCGFFCAFSRRLREVRWRWRGGGSVSSTTKVLLFVQMPALCTCASACACVVSTHHLAPMYLSLLCEDVLLVSLNSHYGSLLFSLV